jgi:integrase
MGKTDLRFARESSTARSRKKPTQWLGLHTLPNGFTVPRDKGGRTSHVRLNDAALSALLRLRDRTLETGYVCGGSAGATDWFEHCLSMAGITGFSWHCLRHTFASRLVMAGADPRTVAELLRDKTLHMAMRYSHLAPDFTLDAVRRMELKFQTDSTPVAPEPNSTSGLVH